MSKEYVFEFQGTKEMFLDTLNKFPNNDGKLYYFNNYIVKLIDDEIHFGVDGAHSGGYWFIPKITEYDNRIQLSGTVQYIKLKTNANQGEIKKTSNKIGEILFFILLLPFLLITKLYTVIKWCIMKLFKRTTLKVKTPEDKLYDLMEKHLNCIRL